jgi:hypothetical protein
MCATRHRIREYLALMILLDLPGFECLIEHPKLSMKSPLFSFIKNRDAQLNLIVVLELTDATRAIKEVIKR